MTFASFTTVIAVFENILSICSDTFGWTRKKSCAINAVVVLVASIPCVLGYNVWSGLTFWAARMSWTPRTSWSATCCCRWAP